jgi:hypothetical protein
MKRGLAIFLIIMVTVFFSKTLFPGNPDITKVAEWGTGEYLDICLRGNHAYCAASKAGLDIIDIADPFNPRKVKNIDIPGNVYSIYISGNYAYVTSVVDWREFGGIEVGRIEGALFIYDITHPTIPILAGTYETDAPGDVPTKVFVKDNYAYVLTTEHMKILDCSKPYSPTLAADFKIDSPHHDYIHYTKDVYVEDGYAYVISATGMHDEDQISLAIIDVSNPADPRLVEEKTDWRYEHPTAIYVKRDYAYIAKKGGLYIMDVSDPRNPYRIGRCAIPDTHWYRGDIKIRGKYAYLASGKKGLAVVNISNPESPFLVGGFETVGPSQHDGIATGLVIEGNHAYVSYGNNGLQVVDISERESPKGVGECESSGTLLKLHYKNNYLYMADKEKGLHVMDVSNPHSPVRRGLYSTTGDPGLLYVSGHYAYLYIYEYGMGKRIDIVDISDPSAPTLAGTYGFNDYSRGIFVSGRYAYILFRKKGLHIVDISNPSAPTLAGAYETDLRWGSMYYGRMYKKANHVYIHVYQKGLLVVDVSNPASPVEVCHLDYLPDDNRYYYPAAMHVDGHYLYIADSAYRSDYSPYREGFLTIMDISHRASPVKTGRIDYFGTTKALHVTGNHAYVTIDTNGLIIFDCSDPASPAPVKEYDTPGEAFDVHTEGDYIYVADGDSGRLMVFKTYDPGTTPYIRLDRTILHFGAASGIEIKSSAPSFGIRNSGGGTLNWWVFTDQAWLSCSPSSGTGSGVVSVSVDAAGLPAGTYTGTIMVSDLAAANSPQTVGVVLTVN